MLISNIKDLKRYGYQLPRSNLLPPYLKSTYFVEYAEIIDETFRNAIDSKVAALRNLRYTYPSNPETEKAIDAGQMLPSDTWSKYDRDVVVSQANLLGMHLATAGSLDTDMFRNIVRNLGTYWWERGTYGFIEFVNYCLGIDLVMENMWTEDYRTFVVEGEQGTPIWEGGLWYPTTHVRLSSDKPLPGYLQIDDLAVFFYEIANYNLVLYQGDFNFSIPVVAYPGDEDTEIVAFGIHMQQLQHITFRR